MTVTDPAGRVGRRSLAGFQPVIEEVGPAPQAAPPVEAEPLPEPELPPVPAAAPAPAAADVPVAVRFWSAASALAFAGQLLGVGPAGTAFCSGADDARWVRTRTELELARELAAAARGDVFLELSTGRLVEDLGWGSAAELADRAGPARQAVDSASLTPTSLAELVRIAGFHPIREQATTRAHVLMPGYLLSTVLERALDLRLEVEHRPVRLHPLFANSSPAKAVALELRMSARRGHIPPSLLAGLRHEQLLSVCRVAGEDDNLLTEYGMASPLNDHSLATMIKGQTWLLSSGRLGCQVIEPRGQFTDSTACVQLSDSQPLHSPTQVRFDDRPTPARLRLVSERTPGQATDAILLATEDLDAIVLLLEGHPLSESAQLIRGRDRHLLVAPGGVLDQLPVGEALYCLGPGLLYLPLGYGTRPRLPPSARQALFPVGMGVAIAVLPTAVLQFSLDCRQPVWALWLGEPPEIDLQLPPEMTTALRELAAVTPNPAETVSATDSRSTDASSGYRTWLDDALEAELRGALTEAAELHARHGDPLRAARLFARAALETAERGG